MPQGLQLFDGNGGVTLNITDRITRMVGSTTLPQNHGAGSVVVPEFARGTGFAMVLSTDGLLSNSPYQATTVSISGTTLSWSTGSGCTIVWGAY